MAEAKITQVNPTSFELEDYSVADENLISSIEVETSFNPQTDYIEYFIYNPNNGGIVYPSNNSPSNYNEYTLEDNILAINPEEDLRVNGFFEGNYNTFYNFLSVRLSSNFFQRYFISEISSDKTEIRLTSNDISTEEIIISTTEFIQERNEDEFFPDFYLNFGNNQLIIANNILLDEGSILIKLYDPLPPQYQLKSTLWVVEQVADPIAYLVELPFREIIVDNTIKLKGPNVNLPVKGQVNNSTEEIDFTSLIETSVTSSLQQINSFYEDPSVKINVDYNKYSNFINFSSAKKRISNLFYKIQQIENWTSLASSGSNVSVITTSGSTAFYQNKINETIDEFDNYEYFLYFTSGSNAYPKTNTTEPYNQASSISTLAQNWITSSLSSAESYDVNNKNWIYYTIPAYLREDTANQPYIDFSNMVGHFYDENIWVYIKDITNKWDNDNRIDSGISRDLIAQQLRDLGFNLYENQFSSFNLFVSTLGLTPSGSYFPFPNMTGSLPTPNGFEYVNNSITGSNEILPQEDINKRIYKRIYNNLSYLYKKKGTVDGIRTLATIYGIPDTLLRIDEFGGKDKDNTNDWDYWFNQFNYAYSTGDDGIITTDWGLNPNWGSDDNVPESLQFRFKLPPSSSLPTSQSLWTLGNGRDVRLVLEYDTTLLDSGSFSGSIPNPNNQYADLKFYPNYATDATEFASVSLPFANNGWWSVMVNREGTNFELISANKIYSGSNGSSLGFIASSSVNGSNSTWPILTTSHFPTLGGITGYDNFSGSYQEIRYYNTQISHSVFKDYVMNPQSIEGNTINSAPDELIFRASLGGELYTGSVSIHPKVTGSWATINSFPTDSDFTITEGNFAVNREYVFMDQPAVGIKNRITDKIRQVALNLPEGAQQLSNIRSIQQDTEIDDAYTDTVNQVEVVLSPTNQINDDIINSIGYLNIGEYIGDPRQNASGSTNYPDLDALRDDYFLKYTSNYDWNDFIRLIKFFDNSLWKTIKDFIPAKVSAATGISIKQHLLERQKYPEPSASYSEPYYTGSIGQTPGLLDGQRIYTASGDYDSIPIEAITGSTGGSFVQLNAISASLTSGGSGYQSPLSNYSVTTTGGGGSGLVISIDSIDENFRLSGTTDLVGSITQTSNDYPPNTYGGTYTTSPSGVSVQLANQVDVLGVPDLILVVLNTSNGVEVGDTITIPAADLGGGALDVIITLQASDLTSTGGAINGITLVDGGSGYTSVPSLTINGSPGSGANIDLSLISQQNWGGSYTTPFGHIPFTQDTDEEFFNGELSGSVIIATTGSLNNPTITSKLVFEQTATVNERSIILFNFKNDQTYQVIIEATNGLSLGDFSITNGNNDSYVFYTSPKINPGDTFTVSLDVEDLFLNTRNLQTPQLAFLPNTTPSGGFFTYTVSIYQNIIDDENLALLNNNVVARQSNIFWDLDYNSNAIQAVNQQAVITASQQGGDLPKAFVQDYNYYSTPIKTRNYLGAKSTSPNVNQNTTSGGFGVLPNVESLGSVLAQFGTGGGTSPEILGAGAVTVNTLLLVDNTSNDVTTLSSDQNNFTGIIEQSFKSGDNVEIYQYSDSQANVGGLNVIASSIQVPTIASFMIPNTGSNNLVYGQSFTNLSTDQDAFVLSGLNNTLPTVEINPTTKTYQTGSLANINFVRDTLVKGIEQGEKWYISLYTTMSNPIEYIGDTPLTPFVMNNSIDAKGDLIDPLGYYGVRQIVSSSDDGSLYFYLNQKTNSPDWSGGGTFLGERPGDPSLGALIWRSNGNGIVVRENTLSGIGSGVMYQEFSNEPITNDLESIVTNFGSKTN